MHQGRTVFSQLIDFLPKREFRRCVQRHQGDKRLRKFSCWDQFLCMAFAQLTYRDSLRDIEACLRAVGEKKYHLGIRGKISRSTLADANNKRSAQIFAEFSHLVIDRARALYSSDKFSQELDNAVYCLDASVIELCLSLCPWSHFDHTSRGGIKLHALLDLRGNIPSFIVVTPRKTYELAVLDQVPLEPGAVYVMDRGYFDLARLYRIHCAKAFFIIRLRRGLSFQRHYSRMVDRGSGVMSDQIGHSVGHKKDRRRPKYPDQLRRIRYRIPETGKYLLFFTNNFSLPAKTIADLYHARWQIELFFKWIKQHLKIKTFYGTSLNAITIQIHIAVTIYVLVAIVKRELKLPQELYTVLQILSVTCFEKTPIITAFSQQNSNFDPDNQQIELDLLGI